jgi:hypothetical protein
MQIMDIAKQILNKIELLEKGRIIISERGNKKAQTISEYEKQMAIVIIKLKNGIEFNLDGEKISNPPATFLEKIARGICWKEKLEMEKSEAEYKAAIVGMTSLEAELSALQSLNRYLDKV